MLKHWAWSWLGVIFFTDGLLFHSNQELLWQQLAAPVVTTQMQIGKHKMSSTDFKFFVPLMNFMQHALIPPQSWPVDVLHLPDKVPDALTIPAFIKTVDYNIIFVHYCAILLCCTA